MEQLLSRFVDAVCAIANEFKRHNDFAAKQPPALRLPLSTDAAPAEDTERTNIIAALTELGEKVHGKTSTPNLKKKLDELLAAKKEAPQKPAEAPAPDPFATGEAAVEQPTIEHARHALVECGKKKGGASVDLLERIAGTRALSKADPKLYAQLIAEANALAVS